MLVVKDRRRTSALEATYLGSDSSHAAGTLASTSAYTSRSKEHGSSSSGRNVTHAVTCRMMAWISPWISLCALVRVTLRDGKRGG